MTKKTQWKIKPPRYSQSADDNGAAISHAVKKTAIPAQETTTLRMMPKIEKTP